MPERGLDHLGINGETARRACEAFRFAASCSREAELNRLAGHGGAGFVVPWLWVLARAIDWRGGVPAGRCW